MTLSNRTIKSLQAKCPVCNKPFTKKNPNQRLCSAKCGEEETKQIKEQRKQLKENNKNLKDYAYYQRKDKEHKVSLKDYNKEINRVRIGNC